MHLGWSDFCTISASFLRHLLRMVNPDRPIKLMEEFRALGNPRVEGAPSWEGNSNCTRCNLNSEVPWFKVISNLLVRNYKQQRQKIKLHQEKVPLWCNLVQFENHTCRVIRRMDTPGCQEGCTDRHRHLADAPAALGWADLRLTSLDKCA